jgi:hypothetical protein
MQAMRNDSETPGLLNLSAIIWARLDFSERVALLQSPKVSLVDSAYVVVESASAMMAEVIFTLFFMGCSLLCYVYLNVLPVSTALFEEKYDMDGKPELLDQYRRQIKLRC